MNINKIFNNDNYKEKNEFTNEPKVIFEDKEILRIVEEWLNIPHSDFAIFKQLIEEKSILTNSIYISKEIKNEISKKVGHILSLAGIDNKETCYLSKYNKDDISFNCHFSNSNKDASIYLSWGDYYDYGPNITIKYPNEEKNYEYYEANQSHSDILVLSKYIINNNDNKTLERYLSLGIAQYILENNDNKLSISIYIPDNYEFPVGYTSRDYKYRLKNEEELQNYLLSLSFPINIIEVYKKISEISIDSVENHSTIDIKLRKIIDEKQEKITDRIVLKYGVLNELTLTKNNKTITINNTDDWIYDSQKLKISQANNGNIDYRIKSITSDEMAKLSTPIEQFNEVNQEVEKVKSLVKTINPKNSNK